MLLSCSSDPKPEVQNDTRVADTLPPQPGLTLFTPDANWVTPTETVSQYGPSGIIRDVVIDRDGIIWMAAWDGIVSYDGKQFTNHTLKNGLSHHRVYSVMEDSKGNMWFGTMGAGAYKYDGNIFTNLNKNNGMINNVVFDLFEDAKGNIWFATPGGVSRYDHSTFVNLDSSNGLPKEIYAISQDTNGVMWIGGEAGLFQLTADLKDGNAKASELLVFPYETHYSNVRDIYSDESSMYFGCANGFYANLFTFNTPHNIALFDSKFTGYVGKSNNSDLLLTSDGIYRYNTTLYKPHESPATRWTTIVEDKSSLGIFGAAEATDGTIWYGAMDGLHSVKDGKDVAYKKP